MAAGVAMFGSPGTAEGNPINSGTGNKFQAETDYIGGTATHLALTRYYNSQDITSSAFGADWHSMWHRGLSVAGSTATVTREDGREDTFTNNGSGIWVADPDVTSFNAGAADRHSNRLEAHAGRRFGGELHAGGAACFDHNPCRACHDAGLQRQQPIDHGDGAVGHTLTFTYGASSHVQQATIPDGGVYAYAYDGNNNLTSVTYPDSSKSQYVYENTSFPNALTGVIDELGNRLPPMAMTVRVAPRRRNMQAGRS